MSDYRDYFNNALTQALERDIQQGNSSKYDEVQRASAEKVAKLELIHTQQVLARKRDEQSWMGQRGLTDSNLAGQSVNAAAQFANGLGAVASMAQGGYYGLKALMQSQGIPDDVKQARIKELTGTASAQDISLLDSVPNNINTRNDSRTFRERIQEMEQSTRSGDDARKFWKEDSWVNDSIVARSATDQLHTDLEGTGKTVETKFKQALKDASKGNYVASLGNVASGVSEGISGLGAAVTDNPQAAIETVANNLPQLIAGLVAGVPGMAATATTYALDEFGKGVSAFQKEHGQLPPQKEVERMDLTAASLAVAEFLGERVTLGAGKLNNVLTKAAAKDVAGEVTRDSFKNSLLKSASNPITRTALAGVEGATGEFATEAYQTYGENQIQGKESSIADIYVGGATGAIAGGGTSVACASCAPISVPRRWKNCMPSTLTGASRIAAASRRWCITPVRGSAAGACCSNTSMKRRCSRVAGIATTAH